MKPLSEQELHNLAMNIVGRQLEAEGYEFMGVNSKPKKNPQFVCLKDKPNDSLLNCNVSQTTQKNLHQNLQPIICAKP